MTKFYEPSLKELVDWMAYVMYYNKSEIKDDTYEDVDELITEVNDISNSLALIHSFLEARACDLITPSEIKANCKLIKYVEEHQESCDEIREEIN